MCGCAPLQSCFEKTGRTTRQGWDPVQTWPNNRKGGELWRRENETAHATEQLSVTQGSTRWISRGVLLLGCWPNKSLAGLANRRNKLRYRKMGLCFVDVDGELNVSQSTSNATQIAGGNWYSAEMNDTNRTEWVVGLSDRLDCRQNNEGFSESSSFGSQMSLNTSADGGRQVPFRPFKALRFSNCQS